MVESRLAVHARQNAAADIHAIAASRFPRLENVIAFKIATETPIIPMILMLRPKPLVKVMSGIGLLPG
jgi:hypothetical protein